jgi:AcrR family transcriptional regulator
MHSQAAISRKRMPAAARREVIELAAAGLFAERGYQGASVEEIARRSGVTPPVLYDHFTSKLDLYRCLLERHYSELRGVWREHFLGDDPAEQRVARSFDAWFAYVEAHPFAGRMLFRDTVGDPDVDAVQRDVAARSRAAIMPLYEREPGSENVVGSVAEGLDMVWVVMRGVLQGLAMWWYDHPDVPRGQVVATAMNSLWIGFERVQRGEGWQPGAGPRGCR